MKHATLLTKLLCFTAALLLCLPLLAACNESGTDTDTTAESTAEPTEEQTTGPDTEDTTMAETEPATETEAETETTSETESETEPAPEPERLTSLSFSRRTNARHPWSRMTQRDNCLR